MQDPCIVKKNTYEVEHVNRLTQSTEFLCLFLSEYVLKLPLTLNMLVHVHTFVFTLHTIRVRKVEKEWSHV